MQSIKRLTLPALALALGSCAPSSQIGPPELLTTTAHFDITCSSALSQLRGTSAHLRPIPYPHYAWRSWSELMVDRWTDTQVVMTSTRSRTNLFPPVPAFMEDSGVFRVTATCTELNRSATLTLSSTGLSPDLMQSVQRRLLAGITVF